MNQSNVPAVQYINVSKTYQSKKAPDFTALKNFDLTINQGDFFGLLGPNGAGKSTAINLLCTVARISSGQIKVMGNDIQTHETECKRLLGIVSQEIMADSFFALPLMLKLQSKLSGVRPDLEWIDYLLRKLALIDHVKKTTRELSGGMKRRMMIARALVHKPKIIVLDEPTAGVDVELRHSMWQFISELHGMGLTVILTTHYLEEAEQFCNRLAILKKGELVTLKSNKELMELGSQPRIIYLFEPTDVGPKNMQWFESTTAGWASALLEKGIEFKMQEDIQTVGDAAGYSLSCNFDEKKPETFQDATQKLSIFCASKNLVPTLVTTAKPSLEEVFLKLAF